MNYFPLLFYYIKLLNLNKSRFNEGHEEQILLCGVDEDIASEANVVEIKAKT